MKLLSMINKSEGKCLFFVRFFIPTLMSKVIHTNSLKDLCVSTCTYTFYQFSLQDFPYSCSLAVHQANLFIYYFFPQGKNKQQMVEYETTIIIKQNLLTKLVYIYFFFFFVNAILSYFPCKLKTCYFPWKSIFRIFLLFMVLLLSKYFGVVKNM